jgi:hypothetical protein
MKTFKDLMADELVEKFQLHSDIQKAVAKWAKMFAEKINDSLSEDDMLSDIDFNWDLIEPGEEEQVHNATFKLMWIRFIKEAKKLD